MHTLAYKSTHILLQRIHAINSIQPMLENMWCNEGTELKITEEQKQQVLDKLWEKRFEYLMGFSLGLVDPGDGTLTAKRALVDELPTDSQPPAEKSFNVSMAWAPLPERNGARQRALIIDTNVLNKMGFAEFVCACIEKVGRHGACVVCGARRLTRDVWCVARGV